MRTRRWWSLPVVACVVLVVPAMAQASVRDLPVINPHPGIVGSGPPPSVAPAVESPFSPLTGASWAGLFDTTVSPPDTNGAIGPSNYIEIINLQLGIYKRTGALVSRTPLSVLTGHPQFNLSDPMVLWDPGTQRFYYNVWDTTNGTMAWGFSKTTHPATAADFCRYTSGFGYASPQLPDYPKLGQSAGFLLIGVNHYTSASAPRADRSDLLWIDKPQGSAAITTCPVASSFAAGRISGLKNANGTQAFTPVPAIQDDNNADGFVVASSDIECPPTCGSGNLITVYAVAASATNPKQAVIIATHSLTVPSYSSPPGGAPQKGSTNTLDTGDGRLEHAVAAINPGVGRVVIWTGHTIAFGSRTQFRWYEISPTPITAPTLVRTGSVTSASLWVFNGAMAPDRAVPATGSASFGDSFVVGFSTSSSTTLPATQMVSSVAGGTTSSFVLVHQSSSADNDFTCTPKCRWGDYGGATSDPTPSLGTHGEVWLTNEAVTAGNNTTWNWEAHP